VQCTSESIVKIADRSQAHLIGLIHSTRSCTLSWEFPRLCAHSSCGFSDSSSRCDGTLNCDYSGVAMDALSDLACRNLHHDSIKNVFYAPMSFFDTTVMPSPYAYAARPKRVLSRLGES
jgi:hypothetical protein